MHHYIALIHKEAQSDFGVSFPDFPGIATAGITLDDARDMAEEADFSHRGLGRGWRSHSRALDLGTSNV